jgi:hypothetical protein
MDKWMSQLPNTIKKLNINNIHLPGTHNSGIYKIDYSFPLENKMFEKFRKFHHIIFPILNAWTLTQSTNIYQLLKMGIRYIDLRISYINCDIYISHTYIAYPLKQLLDEILKFYKEQSPISELLIIDISRDSKNKKNINTKSIEKLSSIIKTHELFKYIYIPQSNIILPTYNEMIQVAKPVLLFLEKNIRPVFFSKNYSYSFIDKKWANTVKVSNNTINMLTHISLCTNNSSFPDNTNKIFIHEETLTPNTTSIIHTVIFLVVKLIFYILIIIACVIAYKLHKNKSKNLIILFYILNNIIIIIGMYLLLKNNFIIKSVKHTSKMVRGSLVEIINDNKHLLKYVSIITADFPNETFINSIIKLNYIK